MHEGPNYQDFPNHEVSYFSTPWKVLLLPQKSKEMIKLKIKKMIKPKIQKKKIKQKIQKNDKTKIQKNEK